MANPKHRNRALCFDSLEQRESPSAVAGAMPRISPAVDRHVVRPFLVTGTATATQTTQQPNGDTLLTLFVQGETNIAGHFQGQFFVEMSKGGGPAEIDAVLYTNVGIAKLTMIVGGHSKTNHPVQSSPSPAADQMSANKSVQGNFSIGGGTGLFVHAIGEGSVNIIPNNELRAIPFMLSGQIMY